MANEESNQPDKSPNLPSNPFSTGGGGTVFELKVSAGLLSTLLVKGFAPGYESAVVEELHLQSEHKGYKTDDALVIVRSSSGVIGRQLWSMKHDVKFTESDTVSAVGPVDAEYESGAVHRLLDPTTALRLWGSILKAVDFDPSEVADLLEDVIYCEDREPNDGTFWTLWEACRDKLLSVVKTPNELTDRWTLTELACMLIFDGVHWKEDAKHWNPIKGNEAKLEDYFCKVGGSPAVFKAFVRILDSVGAMLLPSAILWLDEKLRGADAAVMIGDKNSLFLLSRILSPLVFSRTDMLRKSQSLKDATLRILNAMIDQGSSSAFRMRELLLIPVSPANG